MPDPRDFVWPERAQSIDNIAGQTVNYAYDSLNRLTGAAATGGQWGQAYTFDGFGNLTAKTVTQGSGSNWTQASDPATNRLAGEAYDANGNWLPANSYAQYDVENRMVSRSFPLEGVTEQYFYDPSGKRVGKLRTVGTNQPSAFIYLYDQAGGRTTKECPVYSFGCNRATDDVYFAGKLVITQRGKAVVTDRLGTVRADFSDEPDPPPTPPPPPPLSYLPYGEGQNPPTGAGSQVRFATYTRDSILENQDYAQQRYYSSWLGRFNTADPGGVRTANASSPISWNRYTYVNGDSINFRDPSGLCDDSDDETDCLDESAADGGGFTQGGGGGGACDPEEGCGDGGYSTYEPPSGTDPYTGNPIFSVTGTARGDPVTALAPTPGVVSVIGNTIIRGVLGPVIISLLTPTTTSGTDTLTGNAKIPTVEYVEASCTPIGPPVIVPSKNYPGGKSIEQEYVCPDGSHYTVHTLTTKTGTPREKHLRPGRPKYGQP